MRKLEVVNKHSLASLIKRETVRDGDNRFLHRIHCVLLVAEGCTCYQVAKWFRESPCTVQRWVHCFDQEGTKGLRDAVKIGRPRMLSNKQVKQLQKDILVSPYDLGYSQDKWQGKLLKAHLTLRYDIDLSERQCQRILKKLSQ